MNDSSQHELEDELLSAYLDDELSADERALVEARLAADPAAQQALDQLRNVSQSVRSLPHQSAPSDLQDAVQRRIEGLKKEPNQTAAAPGVSIGRTRRGWIWASLAVAAALLIMFVQTDNEDNEAPPAVAMKRPAAANERGQTTPAPAQWGARDQVAENEPEAPSGAQGLAAAPAAREPATRDLSQSIATSGPAAASAPAVETDSNAAATSVESLADSSSSESSTRGAARLSGGVATDADSAAQQPAEQDEVVVVHVLAKPAAIRNKTFDTLLAKNGVAIDAAEAKDVALKYGVDASAPQPEGAVASGRAYALQRQTGKPADEVSQVEEGRQQQEEVDVVLVEAPSTTIFSCMQDLNHDSDNYLGVLVDPLPATDSAVTKEKQPSVKKLATDLGVYNRGSVPLEPNDAYSGDKVRYDYFGVDGGESELDPKLADGRGGGFGGARQESLRSSSTASSNSDRGRARRLQTPAPGRHSIELYSRSAQPVEGQAAAKSELAGAEVLKRSAMLRELKELSGSGEDPMQVLFVLRAGEESQPSAPAADRAE